MTNPTTTAGGRERKNKFINIKKSDILAKYDFKVDVKKSEPACMQCLPPKPLKGHKTLNGIMVHERIDCPEDSIYLLNFKLP